MIFEVEALVADECGVIRLELVVEALKRVGGLYWLMRRVEGGEEVMGDVLIVNMRTRIDGRPLTPLPIRPTSQATGRKYNLSTHTSLPIRIKILNIKSAHFDPLGPSPLPSPAHDPLHPVCQLDFLLL